MTALGLDGPGTQEFVNLVIFWSDVSRILVRRLGKNIGKNLRSFLGTFSNDVARRSCNFSGNNLENQRTPNSWDAMVNFNIFLRVIFIVFCTE